MINIIIKTMEVNENGKIFFIPKLIGETTDDLNLRCKFILTFNLENLDNLIKLSKLYLYYKKKNCIYDENLMKIIYEKDKLISII